ncbi:hypothetical protein QUA75_22575, partial [Microcoleus sp. M2_C6]
LTIIVGEPAPTIPEMISPSRSLDRTIGLISDCAIENMLSIARILCRLIKIAVGCELGSSAAICGLNTILFDYTSQIGISVKLF